MNPKKISIAIPASVVADTPHLREKTSKIGLIGRAAAIFRIEEIIIYQDNPRDTQTFETNLIRLLLSYLETPQYLRKRLFSLQPELQFAGILPPLRTPHHPLGTKIKTIKVGDYREGVTTAETKKGQIVDIGVERPALLLRGHEPLGKRVTVRITKVNREVEVELAHRDEVEPYWGYSVTTEKETLGKMLKRRHFDLVIATSKHGTPIEEITENIAKKWKPTNTILVAFGAPSQGLIEIARQESQNLCEIADFVINTISTQGTETVRTEEAIFATLAILRNLSSKL